MGLIRDLISNVAGTRMAEQRQRAEQQAQMGDLLGTIIRDTANYSPQQRAQAESLYLDLVNKHGGKQGREIAPKIAGSLTAWNTMQALSGRGGQSISQAQAQSAAGQAPTGQAANTDDPGSPGQLATLAGMTQRAPQAVPQQQQQRRGGVLGALGTVGRSLIGMPREQPMPIQIPPGLLTPMSDEERAAREGRAAGIKTGAAAAVEWDAIGKIFDDPQHRATLKAQGHTDEEIDDMKLDAQLRGVGVPMGGGRRTPIIVTDPDGVRHSWSQDTRTAAYYDEHGKPVELEKGWIVEGKLPTVKAASADKSQDLATRLKPTFQSWQIKLRTENPNWTDAQVNTEARIRTANEFLTTQEAETRNKQITADVHAQLAQLSGVAVPAPWTAAGASEQASIEKTPPPQGTLPEKGQAITSEQDAAAIDEFISRALGLLPYGGRDEYAQLRMSRGLQALKKQTGMSETQIYAAIQFKKDKAKSLNTNVQATSGLKTLQDKLLAFGDLLEQARSQVDESGIPWLDRYLQEGMRNFTGSQATLVGRLDTALNAVSRTYSQVLANNFTSNAMPHVGTEKEARATLAGYMQAGTITGIVDQMRTEAKVESDVLMKRQRELYDDLSSPLDTKPGETPTPPSTPTPTPPAPGKPTKRYNPSTGKFDPIPQ